MAFTNAPTISTQSTERVGFLASLQQRSPYYPDFDAKVTNLMVETYPSPDKKESRACLKTRPGIIFAGSLSAGESRGIYFWNFNGTFNVYSVIGNQFYRNTTAIATLATSTGQVGFTEHVNSSGTVTLFFCDGTNGYTMADPGAALVQITDPQFPTPHIPMPIFLDGYIFLAKKNTQDVYNSDLNAPASWTAGQYISAEMYPDNIIALSKNNNFIYAIGSSSIEYLYNAAIVNGSPLAREASAVQQFGTVAPRSVVQSSKEVMMIGQTGNGGYSIWTVDGFKEKEISTTVIKSYLVKEGANLANAIGSCVRVSGQKLYIIHLTNDTLVYSFDTELWSYWKSGTNNVNNFLGTIFTDGPNGQAYCLIETGVSLGVLNEDSADDLGSPIFCQVVTPKYDFGTMNRKTMSKFTILGEVQPDVSLLSNNFSVEWSDDDYRTWSTPRTVTLQYDFPVISQLGNFRRRAFRITYSYPQRMRLDEMEIEINRGTG